MRYVLQNRLLEGDGTISKIRKVKVLDVDECTYTGRYAEVCVCSLLDGWMDGCCREDSLS